MNEKDSILPVLQHVIEKTRAAQHSHLVLLFCCMFLPGLLLTGCDSIAGITAPTQAVQQTHNTASAPARPVTYSTDAHKVLIRTFYGGGSYGSFELAPQLSIYGDGTYILGTEQQGNLSSDDLQHLLTTLVDTYGLLNLTRQQFSDIPDQNTTFLELAVNGKQQEFVDGSFGNQQESAADLAAYHRLEQSLSAITAALKGPTHPYSNSTQALLVRQLFGSGFPNVHDWPIGDFTLQQAATFECGSIPTDIDPNKESPCLKYTLPNNALLPTASQLQAITTLLNGSQGTCIENGIYYTVILRPLLPDELSQKTLSMFGSAQDSYKGVPLHEGNPPA